MNFTTDTILEDIERYVRRGYPAPTAVIVTPSIYAALCRDVFTRSVGRATPHGGFTELVMWHRTGATKVLCQNDAKGYRFKFAEDGLELAAARAGAL